MKSQEYKEKLERLGVKDIEEEVSNLFNKISWNERLLFWYWHYKEMERLNQKGQR